MLLANHSNMEERDIDTFQSLMGSCGVWLCVQHYSHFQKAEGQARPVSV